MWYNEKNLGFTKVRSEKMGNSLFLAAETAEKTHWALVCLIGIGVVFVGLAVIIGLVELMNFITNKMESKKKASAPAVASVPAPAVAQTTVIENRDELVAAICAAVAEENGTDISAIRVISFKKV